MLQLTGSRAPRWRTELIDPTSGSLGLIDGITGGNAELVALSRLGVSGALTLVERGQNIDWMRHRVRISYDPGVKGVEAWPVATCLFASPKERVRSGVTSFEVPLLSVLATVDEDTTETEFSLPAGTPIISTVRALIESTGETRVAVTDSDASLRSSLVWDAGTSKLTIINELLEAAGYWSLWADGAGQLRVEPYVPPADRAPSFTFAAGEASVHLPDWDREQDLASVPNRFVVTSTGDDTKAAIVGIATNENPESRFSYQARGRWITATEEGAEVASQAAANLLAQRRLLDRMSPVARITATHAILPINTNDLIEFRPLNRDPIRATVQRMSMSFTADALCQAEWREVTSGMG